MRSAFMFLAQSPREAPRLEFVRYFPRCTMTFLVQPQKSVTNWGNGKELTRQAHVNFLCTKLLLIKNL